MKDRQDKLEQFFKKSLDQMNELPSDSIWEGLSHRMDVATPWYLSLFRSWRSWLPIAMLLIAFGGYAYYAQSCISGLKGDMEAYDAISSNKDIELQKKSAKIAALEEKVQGFSTAKKDIEPPIKKQETITESVYKKRWQNAKAALSSVQNQLSNKDVEIAGLRNSLLQLERDLRICSSAEKKEQQEPKLASGNGDQDLASAYVPNVRLQVPPLHEKKGLFAFDSNPSWVFTPSRSGDEDAAINDKKVKKKRNRYDVGLGGKAFITLVENGYHFNESYGVGIRQEYKLSPRLSLTNSLHLNEQSYHIDSNEPVLSDEVLDRFPRSVGSEYEVKRIDVQANYFDATFGAKWTFNPRNEDSQFFINPEAVWQLYLPQSFTYDLKNTSDIVITQNEYVAYLGSARLSLGFDKKLVGNWKYQMALYAERSFIPIGYDEQIMTMVGLSGHVMF